MSDEPYLLVEEVAARLGLPLSVLLRRVEAGDVPSRRVERDDGMHYALRLSDLGIETGDGGVHDPPDDDEPDGISVFDSEETNRAERETRPGADGPEDEGRLDDEVAFDHSWAPGGARADSEPAAEAAETLAPHPDHQTITPAWSTRPIEPRRPPEWITATPLHRAEPVDAAPMASTLPNPELSTALEPTPVEPAVVEAPAAATAAPQPRPPAPVPAEQAVEAVEPEPPRAPGPVAETPPAAAPTAEPPRPLPASTLFEPLATGPRTDLASMSLDARDLVAGLLDRWERTLEQRIYTEQRQRFQVELTARQNMVKELQMELQTARAEHAAAQAEKDRLLAEKERQLAERERDLAETRRYVEEAERGGQASPEARRRRWFRPRGED